MPAETARCEAAVPAVPTAATVQDFIVQEYLEFCLSKQYRALDPSVSYEKHHILSECLGGSDDKANLVALTYQEHIEAHRLLALLHPEHWGLNLAYSLMSQNSSKDFKLTEQQLKQLAVSRDVAYKANARRQLELSARGEHVFQREATKAKVVEHIIAFNKSPESKAAQSARTRERNIANGKAGTHYSQSAEYQTKHVKLVADGRHHWQSPEAKQASSERLKETVVCTHCGKVGKRGGMNKHHLARCKFAKACLLLRSALLSSAFVYQLETEVLGYAS